ncbi:hypothetical protein OH77DRAFT_1001550 [Trametes cingulata]|nr:hypothetical protein OH77DRAFT_1001550 [Trametes cingulata]
MVHTTGLAPRLTDRCAPPVVVVFLPATNPLFSPCLLGPCSRIWLIFGCVFLARLSSLLTSVVLGLFRRLRHLHSGSLLPHFRAYYEDMHHR